MKRTTILALVLSAVLTTAAIAEAYPESGHEEQYLAMVSVLKEKGVIIENGYQEKSVTTNPVNNLTSVAYIPVNGASYVAVYDGYDYIRSYLKVEQDTYAWSKNSVMFTYFISAHDPENASPAEAIEAISRLATTMEVTRSSAGIEQKMAELIGKKGTVTMMAFVYTTGLFPSSLAIYYDPAQGQV